MPNIFRILAILFQKLAKTGGLEWLSHYNCIDENIAETNTIVWGSEDEDGLIDGHEKTTDSLGREKWKGCQHAWLLLGQLQTAI